jgi:hypothetical protein
VDFLSAVGGSTLCIAACIYLVFGIVCGTMETSSTASNKDDPPPEGAKDSKSTPMDEGESDVEIEGMDLEGIDDEDEEAKSNDDLEERAAAAAAPVDSRTAAAAAPNNDEDNADALAEDDAHEMEEARKERMELMAAEQKAVLAQAPQAADVGQQLEYLLQQSEVFAHFLAGTK